jgi:hypothetical protein
MISEEVEGKQVPMEVDMHWSWCHDHSSSNLESTLSKAIEDLHQGEAISARRMQCYCEAD